jgi:hypothetical protein
MGESHWRIGLSIRRARNRARRSALFDDLHRTLILETLRCTLRWRLASPITFGRLRSLVVKGRIPLSHYSQSQFSSAPFARMWCREGRPDDRIALSR